MKLAETRRRIAEELAAALFFAFLAVLMTWPLAPNLRTAVTSPGDPYINLWILDWDWWATFHAPLQLFHGNIFHPARYTLAFSENLYGLALLLFPLRAVGMAPLTAFNVAMLLGFTFSGYAAYRLARAVTNSVAGSLVAGIFFAFVPFRFTHLPHLQHVMAGWLPMLLLALIHYTRKPSAKRVALFAAAFLMNGLTNVHWFLFGSLSIAVAAVILGSTRRDRSSRYWMPLLLATGAAMLLLLPFLIPYIQASHLYGMQRSYDETLGFSATWSDWLIASPYNRLYGQMTNDLSVEPERWLFPGLAGPLLAIAAWLLVGRGELSDTAQASLLPIVRERQLLRLLDAAIVPLAFATMAGYAAAEGGATFASLPIEWLGPPSFVATMLVLASVTRLLIRYPLAWGGDTGASLRSTIAQSRMSPPMWAAAAWIVIGVIGSLGLHAFFHQFLFDYVPGFRGLRVPARWAMIADAGLSLFVGAGAAALLRRCNARMRTLAGVAIPLALLFELNAAPIRWYLTLPEPPGVYAWLREAKLSGGVVELPFDQQSNAYQAMFYATAHHQPILNGISGFAPPDSQTLSSLANARPIPPAFEERLARMGCELVLVHADLVDDETRAWLRRELALQRIIFLRRFDHGIFGDWLFALGDGRRRAAEWAAAEHPDAAARVPSENLALFLDGKPTYNNHAFGLLDTPLPGDVPAPYRFYGFAFSPWGVDRVNLVFDNGRVTLPAHFRRDYALGRAFPWYPRAKLSRFELILPQRPAGVSRRTDVQVEIIDWRGERTMLDDRWITFQY